MLRNITMLLLVFASHITHALAPVPAPPSIAANGYLLFDFDSGKVIAEKNADERLEPASLTKIMTAYVVFQEIKDGSVKLDDQVLVSERAWKTPGSRMFIEVGSSVAVDDLLRGMIIQSGNDASVALAEHVAGSESAFANLMNDYADRLGMRSTHFTNSTGLPDDNHYTTARDIGLVTEGLIRHFPEFYKLYSIREYTYNGIKQQNRNNLLGRDKSVDGVKTGYTEAAGYCLVSSAKRQGMRLISVMLGTDSAKARERESQSLLNFGFRFYETHRLYGAGDMLLKARIWMGDQEQIPLGLADDLYVTIPRRQYKNLNARTEVDPDLEAPVSKGQKLGEVVLELSGDEVARVPLVALRDIASGGIWRKGVDSVMRLFN